MLIGPIGVGVEQVEVRNDVGEEELRCDLECRDLGPIAGGVESDGLGIWR